MNGKDVTRLRAVDWFTMGYLGVSLIPMLIFQSRDSVLLSLSALHVLGIGVIIAARRLGLGRSKAGAMILIFYPIVLSAFLYTEIGTLCRVLQEGVLHDDIVQGWEQAVFGGQPSQDLYLRWNSRALGEYLHLGYVSYYLLAPILVAVLWFRRPRIEVEECVATISLSFYIAFLIFIAFPVAGPYHKFTRIDPDLVGFQLPYLTRFILDRGSSIGAAFPSSHVAVSVVVWIMAMRFHTGMALAYAFLVPALGLGAIFGGYHYAIDAVAGAVLGLLVGTLGYKLTLRLSRPST